MMSKNVCFAKERRQTQKRCLDDAAVHLGMRRLFAMEEVATNTVDSLDEVRPISGDGLTSVHMVLGASWLKFSPSIFEIEAYALVARHMLFEMNATATKLLSFEDRQEPEEGI